MRNQVKNMGLLVLFLAFMSVMSAYSQRTSYLCDFGIQGGAAGYYGDANRIREGAEKWAVMGKNIRWTAGAQFRYKFSNRWALQVKGQYQQLAFSELGKEGKLVPYESHMANVDAVGEFNFFRYGENSTYSRVKPYTPYLFMGFGVAVYGAKCENISPYFPIGMGFKWRFAPRWQLVAAWQHNVYFKDNIESKGTLYGAEYDNPQGINGSNIINNDLTWQCTMGIVFEFAKQKSACRHCDWNNRRYE